MKNILKGFGGALAVSPIVFSAVGGGVLALAHVETNVTEQRSMDEGISLNQVGMDYETEIFNIWDDIQALEEDNLAQWDAINLTGEAINANSTLINILQAVVDGHTQDIFDLGQENGWQWDFMNELDAGSLKVDVYQTTCDIYESSELETITFKHHYNESKGIEYWTFGNNESTMNSATMLGDYDDLKVNMGHRNCVWW